MPQPKKTGGSSSARKSAARPAARKAAARKPAARKPAARTPAARTPAARKAAARTPAARKPAAANRGAAKPAAAKRASATTARTTRGGRPPAAKSRATAAAPDDLVTNLTTLRDRLVSSLTLTTDRLQDTVDDAVRRGRITRRDAEDLLATLVNAGRAQTEALLADVEQLLGLRAGVRSRAAGSSDAVLRTVDRARRRAGVGGFPILNYDELTAAQIGRRLADLTPAQLRKVRDHERRHDGRRSVLAAIERRLR